MLAAHVRAFGHPSRVDPERFQLIAPFEKDPSKWLDRPWTDRYSGKRYEITTRGYTGGIGVARVKSYGEVISEFRGHREDKSLAPEGSLCAPETCGLLRRRPVVVRDVKYIGKESNRLDDVEAKLVHAEGDVLSSFERPVDLIYLLREIPTAELMVAMKRDRSTIKRWKAGQTRPRAQARSSLARLFQQSHHTSGG